MAKKRKNYDILKSMEPDETIKARDVQEDQQLERGYIDEMETMTSRNIIALVTSLIIGTIVWFTVSFFSMLLMKTGKIEQSVNPAYQWVWVEPYYVNKNDDSDKITKEEYEEWLELYEPGAAPAGKPEKPKSLSSYTTRDDGSVRTPDGSVITAAEYEAIKKDYDAAMEQYISDMNAYKLYQKQITNPEGRYEPIIGHYRNKSDFSKYLTTDGYNKLVAKYEKKLKKGKYSSEQLAIPGLEPIKPSTLYKGYEWVYDSSDKSYRQYLTYNNGRLVEPKEPKYVLSTVTNDYYNLENNADHISAEEYANRMALYKLQKNAYETELVKQPQYANGHYDELISVYRNVLDGTLITADEYEQKVLEYNAAVEEYKTAYLAYRQKYHPDDIYNEKRVFSVKPTPVKVIASLSVFLLVFGVLHMLLVRNLKAQNLMRDTSDINQHHNDQHIAMIEDIQEKYDWFPDAGAHSAVQVSSMISHMALANKGLKKIQMAQRAETDIVSEDGEIEYQKGEMFLDENGEPLIEELPIVDTDFMEELFEVSGAEKKYRTYYDASKIKYNPDGKDRDKLGKYATVADLINDDWELPLYEPQRPAGAYIVDTAPVNTMILAITRAGKGQTYIEPVLDMWMREKRPNNMVVNDPKGELIVKNYVKATVRGFHVVQFNLINPVSTDIYNPLALAVISAREGDNVKCSAYVDNIAKVFFPVDTKEDPVWPNAANNAFKRAAYGLIDYYLEEEKAMRRYAARCNIDEKILEQKIDMMWGKVTLYNCYQLFTQLSSKKLKNPSVQFIADSKAGKFDDMPADVYQEKLKEMEMKSALWDNKTEMDCLSLFFSATSVLPKNAMRGLVENANNSLKSMSGAEKMLSSVYGIAITAMSFFTDPTIMRLTSGTPEQNVDLGGLSFPRRIGVRFSSDYMYENHFVARKCLWSSYSDPEFKNELGKDFRHEDRISPEGWARYYFDGKYESDVSYIKLEIRNEKTDNLIRSFYFEFHKAYQTSLNGRTYVKDPILGEKIVKNGYLYELRKFRNEAGNDVYKRRKTTFKQKKILDISKKSEPVDVQSNAIISTSVRYSEKPKAIYLITPPHLMNYAKLILILVKQLVDDNFDRSYMTKDNQKPLYKTRFMLDELGNLQSDGNGIQGLGTMLSIGLGQDQQFTLILQTLQQLRDIYGDSVDKIIQGNVSNIVFLKSTDDSMIETLSKMSGVTHKAYIESKTVTKDTKALIKMVQTEGKVSYTMSVKEDPLISYNDMAYISERNSIVFRAGDPPIWNRNQTVLPMSYKLFENTISQPGKKYSLKSLPTMSTALEFDARKNQPDFRKMLEKRMKQAYHSQQAQKQYKEAYGFDDVDIEKMDPEVYSDEIMDLIAMTMASDDYKDVLRSGTAAEDHSDKELEGLVEMFDYMFGSNYGKKNTQSFVGNEDTEFDEYEDNAEQKEATDKAAANYKKHHAKRFAGETLSRADLVSISVEGGQSQSCNHSLDKVFVEAYMELKKAMDSDSEYFTVNGGNLCGTNGAVYIRNAFQANHDYMEAINEAAKAKGSRVYADSDINEEDMKKMSSYVITDAFLIFLSQFKSEWPFADGAFARKVHDIMTRDQEDVAS